MLIGDLSRESGVSRDTIRYYEKRGLIGATYRRDNNYKEYPADAPGRLKFIGRMKASGFTLREISDLLKLVACRGPICGVTGPALNSKLSELDRKIAQLRRIRADLKDSFSACPGTSPEDECTPVSAFLSC